MIYLVRHGRTASNQIRLLSGRKDVPLDETGIRQAKELREKFIREGVRFAKAYSSPLSRAVQTARIVSGGVSCAVDERLIEMDFGPYEGMNLDDPAPEVKRFLMDTVHVPAPPGMETIPHLVARFGAFLEDIREEARVGDILVATHAIAMKGGFTYLTPGDAGGYWSRRVSNCGVFTVEARPEGGWSLPKEWYNP